MFWSQKKPERLYLDYAAATPLHPDVLAAMQSYLTTEWGNASAIHAEGQAARTAVEEARLKLARALGVRPQTIIFTGSGTESNNLAIYGHLRALHEERGAAFTEMEIISTKLEHPSVLEVLKHLEEQGVVVKYVAVDEYGRIDTNDLQALLNERTRLVTFAYGNSEIGTVQPVKRITRHVKKFNTEHGTNILTHLDAAQAPLWLPCQVPQLGVDLMALDAGKCQGPKGVGVLVAQPKVTLKGITLGGGQERGLRAATENVAGIVGAGEAIVRAQVVLEAEKTADTNWDDTNAAVSSSAAQFLEILRAELPEMILNGPEPEYTTLHDGPTVCLNRLANNINISLPGIDTEFAVVVLDKHGIAASTKSACSGAGGGESGVVKAISGDAARASSTIRFTLGPDTDLNADDMKRIAKILKAHVKQMMQVK